jgi:methylated-DNA-[protein]-cysteine S-methyltransferase
MIDFSSSIAYYGEQNIPTDFIDKADRFGLTLICVKPLVNQSGLGSKMSTLVNQTSALFIFEFDENLPLLISFFQAANKSVFFISEEESNLPKAVKHHANVKAAFLELLKETDKTIVDTKIGKVELRFNAFGLIYLKTNNHEETTLKPSHQALKVQKQLEAYLEGKRKNFHLKIGLFGTEFQRNVWKELINIPYGKTISYGELAVKVDHSSASRAVGHANGKNPIWIVVPCHRVISKDGDLTGYAGGLDLKQWLLELESDQMSLF